MAAAARLRAAGIEAAAFPCDLSSPDAVRELVGRAAAALGPIAVVHWNAYASTAGDLLAASTAEVRQALDVAVTSLVAAVQAAHAHLSAHKGAVLITGGGFAFYDPQVDAMATQWHAMGLAVTKAAQHKLAGLLSARLAADGIYVGEVVVTGIVKGTAFDQGHGTLEAATVAEKMFELFSACAPLSVTV